METDKVVLSELDKFSKLLDYLIELNNVTKLYYSCYIIEGVYWLKKMNNANSNESIDWRYKSLDDLYNSLKKTLDDATLLKELTNGQ